MPQRITVAHLDRLAAAINDELGTPQTRYAEERDDRGRPVANAGHVYVAGAYSGYRLEVMCRGGGSRDLLSGGYCGARACYDMGHAFLAGLRYKRAG